MSSATLRDLPSLADYLKDEIVDIPNCESKAEVVEASRNANLVFALLVKLLRNNTHEAFLEYCKWIILGGEPDRRVKELFQEGKLYSRACSQVWGQGELAYRCQTCGLSSASSLCVTCFQNGNHEGHNYQIYCSSFGGCCDCGNAESWKPDGNCCHHPGDTGRDPLDCIREDPTLGDGNPGHICIHILMLFLDRSIALVRIAEEKLVDQKTTELDGDLVGFAKVIIPWFGIVASLGDPLRCIIGHEFLTCCLNTPGKCYFSVSMIEDESLYDLLVRVKRRLDDITFYDSSALLCRLSAHLPIADPLINLYLQLLYDDNFKKNFMRSFIRFYPSLAPFMKTIDEASDKRIMDDFINRVTAQLWNIHDLVMDTVKDDHNLLGTLMDTLLWILVQAVPRGQITLDCEHRCIDKDHYWSFVTDVITLLTYAPTAQYVMVSRKDLLSKWIYILALSMDMNPNTKQTVHVEMESNIWRNSFSLELTFSRSYEPLFRAFAHQIETLKKEGHRGPLLSFIRDRIRMVTDRLADIFDFNRMKTTLKSQGLPGGKEIMLTDFDMSKRPISMHLPLHRVLAGLLQHAAMIDDLETIISRESLSRHFLECLIEHPMRIQALCAQSQAKLWVRNGNSLQNQIFLYKMQGSFYDDGYDYDLLLLQALCVLLGPDAFITIAVKRFQVQQILLMPFASSFLESNVCVSEPVVVSELLRMFINVLTHRTKCGMSTEACIRREIIHCLAAKDLTFSGIQSSLCSRLSSHKQFESILNEVAEYISASVFTEGCYKLKADSWNEYDPYFPHHSPRERQQAQDRYFNHLKSTKQISSKGLLPPVVLHRAYNSFGRTITMLWCPSMLYIYYIVLFKRNSTIINDDSLHAVLYLLSMAIEYAPISPSTFSGSQEEKYPFSHSSFDQNINDTHCLPGGSLLSQLIQLHESDVDENLLVNIKQLLLALAERNEDNKAMICNRVNLEKENHENEDKESLKEQARKRQEEVMLRFSNAQQEFLNSMDELDFEDDENLLTESYDCVLCRDSSSLQQSVEENRPFGLAAFLQKSNLMKSVRKREHASVSEPPIDLLSVNINDKPNDYQEERTYEDPLHSHIEGELLKDIESSSCADIRFCGHYVHLDCTYRYFASLCQRHQAMTYYEGTNVISITNGEFLCPSCRRLCNCVIPLTSEHENLSTLRSSSVEKIPQELQPLQDMEQLRELLQWKIPAEYLEEDRLTHKANEENPSAYSQVSGNSSAQILPSAPVAPVISGVHAWSESVDILLQRVSGLQSGTWMGSKIEGPYAYQMFHFFLIIRERLCSLELRSRAVHYSFVDFVSTQDTEMQANQLLFNICQTYRATQETVTNYRKFISSLLLRSLCAVEEEHPVDLLICDPFAVLISVVCVNAVNLDHVTLFRVIGSLFLLNIFQSFITIQSQGEGTKDYLENVDGVLEAIRNTANDSEMEKQIQMRCVKYLKQAGLLVMMLDSRIAKNIPLGLALDRDSSQFTKDYEQLCCLLAVPSSTLTILQSPMATSLITKWMKIRKQRMSKMEETTNIFAGPLQVRKVFIANPFEFVKLPKLFQQVYQHLVRQRCDVCEEATPEIGICLTCGQVICAGTKHLLGNVGARDIPNTLNVFVSHAKDCGGVFLVLKLSTILLFRGRRISVWHSIYLDEHGEEDLELKRGKPLFIDESRLEQLLKLVLAQDMDHDTRILAKTQLLGMPN